MIILIIIHSLPSQLFLIYLCINKIIIMIMITVDVIVVVVVATF